MTLQEAERRHIEASQEYARLLKEREETENHIRCQEAEAARKLRKAEKVEVREGAGVFESIGMPPAAAKAAAQGREERF